MTGLHLAPKFALPLDVAGEAIALIAKRGAGKTNTGIVLAEEMLDAKVQIVALDPVGAWWGLRSKYEIPILGGQHGDVPLEPTAGALIADVVVDTGTSLVLDLSSFATKAEVARFVRDFLDRLYRRLGEQPRAIHVFLEEADEFAPQKPFKDETRMLSAVEQVVRRGRGRGLGVTLITQRAAVLNKNVLEQTDVLIALRTTGPNDRKAIEGWIGTHSVSGFEPRELSRFKTGQAVIWNPEREIFEIIQIRARKTLDVSGRIAPGARTGPAAKLKPIDLSALGEQIQETVERVKANDPAELRRQIQALERRNAELAAQQPAPAAVETIEVPVIADGQVVRLEQFVAAMRTEIDRLADQVAEIAGVPRELLEAIAPITAGLQKISGARAPLTAGADGRASGRPTVPRRGNPEPGPLHEVTPAAPRTAREPRAYDNDVVDENVKAGARRIVETLARHYPMRVTRAQLGTLTGFKITGGTFQTYFSQLKRLDLIEEASGEISITEKGLAFAGVTKPEPMSTEEVLDMWRGALKRGAREMLDLLVMTYPRGMAKDELAERLNMTASGGTFQTYLSTLRRNGLADVDGAIVSASESLFLGVAA